MLNLCKFPKLILVLSILILAVASCGNDQHEKNTTAVAFLKYYRSEVLKNKSILLLDTPSDSSLQHCLLKITYENEYALFNKDDFADEFHSTLWDKKSIDGVKFISNEDLPNIMTPKGKSDFRKNFGEGYYVFSHPIVSKDLNYILFYTSYWCGERCGYGAFTLFKKTKTGWKLMKKYCDWVS